MKRPRSKSPDKGAIELIEEAVHLLRQSPLSSLAAYYIGALPFVIGLLYFWAQMSRSPFAYQHLAGESLGLAALFLWMKVWQVRFARSLWAQISGGQPPSFTLRQWVNILISQSALQVSGLFLLPVALVITAPFGWVYAFYQNLTALADPDKASFRAAFAKARKHATFWPRQNHVLLTILFGFAVFVLLNWLAVCLSLPALAKTFFGIETVFTRSVAAMLNSTFFAAMLALTYLSVDPLVKAVYTVRCFYGEARHSGEDIKADLKQMAVAAASLAVAVVVVIFGLGAICSNAQDKPRRGGLFIARLSPTPVLFVFQRRDDRQFRFATTKSIGQTEKIRSFRIAPLKNKKNECSVRRQSINRSPLRGLKKHVTACAPIGPSKMLGMRTAETLGYFQTSLRDEAKILAALAADSSAPIRSQAAADGPPITAGPSSPPSVPPSELDQKIQQVLKESKYIWRFPRDTVKPPETEKGPIGRFFESVADMLRHWLASARDWLKEIFRKLFEGRSKNSSGSGSGWIVSLHLLLYLLIAVVVACVAFLLYRLLTRPGGKQTPIVSEPLPSAPNLLDENVGAEQLPEDSWTTLGRELLQRGELRLALRAFYLASLAHLASRNLISLARFKSNRDYYRELERRGHSFPQLLALFADNVTVFDRIWYGMHEITPDLVNQFLSKVDMIKAGS